MGGSNISSSTRRSESKLAYGLVRLSELFELGLTLDSEMDPDEVRLPILASLRRAIGAPGACLLLYYKAQERFVPVASQGEKFPCGSLAAMLNAHVEKKLSRKKPVSALESVELEGFEILLVPLICSDVFIGLVALPLPSASMFTEEQSLLLTYMGSIAAQILSMSDARSSELRTALAEERDRIGRDLHDGVVQQLAFVFYKLEIIQHLLESGSVQQSMAEIERISTIIQESLQELRSITTSLLPFQLSTHTFSDALASLLDDFRQDNPDIVLEQQAPWLPPLPSRVEATAFRVIQEALNNIRKHAMATKVKVRLKLQDDVLQFEIHDNGRGFDARSIQTISAASTQEYVAHNGLRGMYQRIKDVGGTWHVSSQPGAGTTVEATFPLLQSAPELTQREREILQLIVAGLDNHAIARKLSIRNETVKKHVQHITQKLHVKDRSEVAVVASRRNSRSFP